MLVANVGILFLIAIIVGVVLRGTRGWSKGSPGRGPFHRHWITRLVCGVLGFGLLAAFAVVTLRDARSVPVERQITLRVPTLPPPDSLEVPKPPTPDWPVSRGRYLLQMAVTKSGEFPGHPIATMSVVLRWPKDQDRLQSLLVQDGDRHLRVDQHLRGILIDQFGKMEYLGNRSISGEGPHWYHSRSGGLEYPDIAAIGGGRRSKQWFHLGRTREADLILLSDLTRIRDDDPLRPATLDEWIALRGEAAWKASRDSIDSGVEYVERSSTSDPATALAEQLGFNVLPLLAAMVLLSQLFRNRPLGLVKAAACIILFLGALDRVSLRMRVRQAHDTSAALETRLKGCSEMQGTFFFRKTADSELGRIAANAESPKILRSLAKRLSGEEK